MKKSIFFFCCFMSISSFVYSQTANTKNITLEIRNVITDGGKLYVSVSLNEASYKASKPELTFEIIPTNNTVRQNLQLPTRECAFTVYQDTNNNGKMDTGFLGIPKEPAGISNWSGKGPPGNYNKQKVDLNTVDTVTVELHKF